MGKKRRWDEIGPLLLGVGVVFVLGMGLVVCWVQQSSSTFIIIIINNIYRHHPQRHHQQHHHHYHQHYPSPSQLIPHPPPATKPSPRQSITIAPYIYILAGHFVLYLEAIITIIIPSSPSSSHLQLSTRSPLTHIQAPYQNSHLSACDR